MWERLEGWWGERLDEARLHVARPEALLLLSALGLLTGLIAGMVIVGFRLLVESSQGSLLAGSGPEDYESLSLLQRILLPLAGAVALAALFRWGAKGLHRLGVAHVIERMAHHQGHMSMRGFILQFVGAAIAIVAGYSVGREGPHVHLGAASGSLLGQRLGLPNNAIRTLAGCGAAAGIAASFNTPLAGVVFALEVVMLEYTVASFIPIILAAVAATLLANAVLGDVAAFSMPALSLGSAGDLVYVLLLGILAGMVSAALIRLLRETAARSAPVPIWWRMFLAGAATGVLGMSVPEVMGIGYDTVELALQGQLALGLLSVLLVAKLAATVIAIGLGVPGGVIGPVLFMGAMLGALVSHATGFSGGSGATDIGLYALLGMGAMMAASFQAPLAALMAILELTHNPGVILPGMLAVVVASLTASELFRQESLFIALLRAAGREPRAAPPNQFLQRRGVASVMDRTFARVQRALTPEQVSRVLANRPTWLLIDEGETQSTLMPAVDLVRHLESTRQESGTIDLLEIPAKRLHAAPIDVRETLQQGLERLDRGAEALYVERVTGRGARRVYGVLTRSMIESVYG